MKTKITVYDMNGKELQTLYNGNKNAGSYSIFWNPADGLNNYASGIYCLRLSVGNQYKTIKMSYLK